MIDLTKAAGLDDPLEVVKALLRDNKNTVIADYLEINSAHVSNADLRDHVSPTLRKALIQVGLIPAPPKRIRACIELKTAERKAALEAWAAVDGLTLAEKLQALADDLIAGKLPQEPKRPRPPADTGRSAGSWRLRTRFQDL